MLSRAKTVKSSQARDVAVSLSICRRNPPQDAYTQAGGKGASHFFVAIFIGLFKSLNGPKHFFFGKDTSSGMGLVRSAGFFQQLSSALT